MSDEHFLARWSRRKREVATEQRAPDKPDDSAEAKTQVATRDATRAPADEDVKAAAQPPSEMAFDLAKLPSLDSITEATDVRGFLGPGVPTALTRAALRRAWSADPAIRDFVGLQEYDWDFNTPGAVPGFGELGSEHDLKGMVARIFGETPEQEPATAAEAAAPPDQPVVQTTESKSRDESQAAGDTGGVSHLSGSPDPPSGTEDLQRTIAGGEQSEELVHRNKEVAPQYDDLLDDGAQKNRRSHGGALPKS